jgi:hypothetical protein
VSSHLSRRPRARSRRLGRASSGIFTRTRVPFPDDGLDRKLPFTRRTRSCMPRSPRWPLAPCTQLLLDAEGAAVVPYLHVQGVVRRRELDLRGGRPRVLEDVVERLLRHAEEHLLPPLVEAGQVGMGNSSVLIPVCLVKPGCGREGRTEGRGGRASPDGARARSECTVSMVRASSCSASAMLRWNAGSETPASSASRS